MADKMSRGSLWVLRAVTGAGTAAASILPFEQRAEAQQQFTRVETGQTVQLSTIAIGQPVTG